MLPISPSRSVFQCFAPIVFAGLILGLFLASVWSLNAAAQSESNASESSASSAAEALHELFEQEWEWRLNAYSLAATVSGWRDTLSALPDVSSAAQETKYEETQRFLEIFTSIKKGDLSRRDQVSAQLFESQLRDRLAAHAFGAYQMPVHTQGGFHQTLTFLPRVLPLRTEADLRRYIQVLRDVPRYVEQHTENMRLGLERGMTQPAVSIRSIQKDVSALAVDDPEASPFYSPFASLPDALSDAQRSRVKNEGRAAIADVSAAFQAFAAFLESYAAETRIDVAATSLPDGEAYYDHLIRRYTTLPVSADSIHRLGLSEVDRIRAEMDAVIDAVGFEGSLQAFIDTLRTDPRFTPSSEEAYLKEAAWIAKRMDGELPALFGTLPRQPYTVEPVPEALAPTYTVGRYIPAPPGGTRAGAYWLNTHDLESRALYTLEALTLHEAVPGHHLQVALSRELEDLPAHRRNGYVVAFGEGWGLYAERLGVEAGFYQDPYSNFGRLTYEMWRACRLVVDTGMHAKGWSRQRAIDFMASNTALPDGEVVTEIDRYISWPGQALGYKMGELKIRALRERAEQALGEDFDVRAFHDVVLGSGPVTLPVLEENVERWVGNVD